MSLRSIIFDQIWLKLFSVVLATLIWLAVRTNIGNEPLFTRRIGNEDINTFINRPILILTESTNHPPLFVSPERAEVTVRGPPDLMQGLREEDINVFVRYVDRNQLVSDLPVHVHLPAGAVLARVKPITALVKAAPPATSGQAASKPTSP
jgi:hypothetical protein